MSNNRDKTLAKAAGIVDSIIDKYSLTNQISHADHATFAELKILIRDIQLEELRTGKISEDLLYQLFESLEKIEDVTIYSDSGAYKLQSLHTSLENWLAPYVEVKSLHHTLTTWLKLFEEYASEKRSSLALTEEMQSAYKTITYIKGALNAIEANKMDVCEIELSHLNIMLSNHPFVKNQPELTREEFNKKDLSHFIRLAYQVSEPYNTVKNIEEDRVNKLISLLRSLPTEKEVNVSCARTYIDTKASLNNHVPKLSEKYIEDLCNKAVTQEREEVNKLKNSIIDVYSRLHSFVFDLDSNMEISVINETAAKYLPKSNITRSDLEVLTSVLREKGITLSNSYMNPNAKDGFVKAVESMFSTRESSEPVIVTYSAPKPRFAL